MERKKKHTLGIPPMWTSWQVTWVSLSPYPAGLKDLFLFFFQEQSPSDWLVTSSVSGCQRDNTDPLCEEREGSNQEGHLDGAEKHLSSCQRLSAPRWSQPWEREQGNLHPQKFRIGFCPGQSQEGKAAPGRNLSVPKSSQNRGGSLASCTALTPPSISRLCLVVFKGLFYKSQHALLIPLAQAVKRALCKNHPKELSELTPVVQEGSGTAENPKNILLSTGAGLGLAKLSHQMAYLRGQQHFPLPPQPLSAVQSQL